MAFLNKERNANTRLIQKLTKNLTTAAKALTYSSLKRLNGYFKSLTI